MSALPANFSVSPPIAATAVSPVSNAPEVLDVTGAFGVLWRRKFHLLWAALASVLLGVLWLTTVATPLYQATAVLVMTKQEAAMPSIGSLLPGLSSSNDAANTEVETLRARSLLGLVVDDLDLTHDPDFNPDPENALSYIAQNTLAQWVPFIPAPTTASLTPGQTRTLTIDNLIKVIDVRNVPDSLVFEVAVESGDPAKAAQIANALSQHYIDRQISVKAAKNTQITKWLDTRVAQLQRQLEQKEADFGRFSASMELVSPETHATLSAEFKALRSKIISLEDLAMRKPTTQLTHKIDGLRKLEKTLSAQLTRQSADLGQLQQLEREVLAARQIYTQFLGQLKETTAKIDLAQPDSAILSVAEIPISPARPRPMLVLLMAAVLGAFLAGARVLFQETGRQVFRTELELEEATGQGVLGQVPLLPARFKKGLLSQLAIRNGGEAQETLRQLRSSIFVGPKTDTQVVMVTSSLPNEGRSVLALALAKSVAQLGQRVLVIDGDLRHQGLAKVLKMPSGQKDGFLNVLARRSTLVDTVWHCQTLGIDVLGGSSGALNPADLFHQVAFRRMLRTARETYDLILIDTPPVLAVPDARVVGAQADAILYAVQWNQTKSAAVLEGLRHLRQSRLRVRGLVLTQVDGKALRRYGFGPHRELRKFRNQKNSA